MLCGGRTAVAGIKLWQVRSKGRHVGAGMAVQLWRAPTNKPVVRMITTDS